MLNTRFLSEVDIILGGHLQIAMPTEPFALCSQVPSLAFTGLRVCARCLLVRLDSCRASALLMGVRALCLVAAITLSKPSGANVESRSVACAACTWLSGC